MTARRVTSINMIQLHPNGFQLSPHCWGLYSLVSQCSDEQAATNCLLNFQQRIERRLGNASVATNPGDKTEQPYYEMRDLTVDCLSLRYLTLCQQHSAVGGNNLVTIVRSSRRWLLEIARSAPPPPPLCPRNVEGPGSSPTVSRIILTLSDHLSFCQFRWPRALHLRQPDPHFLLSARKREYFFPLLLFRRKLFRSRHGGENPYSEIPLSSLHSVEGTPTPEPDWQYPLILPNSTFDPGSF